MAQYSRLCVYNLALVQIQGFNILAEISEFSIGFCFQNMLPILFQLLFWPLIDLFKLEIIEIKDIMGQVT
jgi:hypothetical protein